MHNASDLGFTRRLVFGVLSGAAGTAAMDVLLYTRYRRGGGGDPFWKWEFAEAVKKWDDAPAPGQLGRKLEEAVTQRPAPDGWARSTTNLVHWVTGGGWGLQYGALTGKTADHRWRLALTLGPAAWLTSYVVLPLAKVYKPIWDYDGRTLAEDLSAHVLYGVTTATTFAALARAG